MRQLMILVRREQADAAFDLARRHEAVNLVRLDADEPDRRSTLVIAHVGNQRVEALVGALQALDSVRVTIVPRGVIALRPPPGEAPAQVTDVSHRSALEVFLGGLQSVGSWKGFLGYAACAAVVAWIGLHTNTWYLLTAAMLIAPFAGPAITLALGTARGDRSLVGRSLLRYAVSLSLTVAIAAALSLVLGQRLASELMVNTSMVSSFALLLPLVAGAAGALNLCQSERDSLVTAAGPGMLIAASLAPPAVMIGMAGAIGRWDMAANGLFVLLLQLVGINLSGSLVFRLFGLSPSGVRYDRGRSGIRWLSLGATAIGLAALLGWQFWSSPDLQRTTREQRMAHTVKDALRSHPQVHPVDVNVRFTRADLPGQNTVLVNAWVQHATAQGDAAEETKALKDRLTAELQSRIRAEHENVTPLVDVTVLTPPP